MPPLPKKKSDSEKRPKAPLMRRLFPSYGYQEDKEYLLDTLTMLLASGTDMLSALSIVHEDVRSGRMLLLIDGMQNDIGNGLPLSKTLERANILAPREIALLKIGEESGKITDSLEMLAKQGERDRQFTAKIRSATLYPVFVLSIAVILGVGIAWFILPKLASIFDQLDLKLPLATRIVVAAGKFLQAYGITVVPSIIAFLSFLVYLLFFFKKTRHLGQSLLLHTPGIKDLIKQSEISRFGYLFGTLLDAGVPIVVSLNSLEESTTIVAYQKLYRHLSEGVLEGQAVHKSFRQFPKSEDLIPPAAQHMIAAAAESGKLAKTLLLIGERFEAKVEITTKNLGTLLEPALIIIIWGAVMMLAFAIITPIYSLIGGLT